MGLGPYTLAGQGLRQFFRLLKIVRPLRPIHPQGVSLIGSLERLPTAVPSGISWIDTPGTCAVRARMSRAAGLPAGWPDVLGLALRITSDSGFSDVLFSSTGLSRPGRFLLVPRISVSSAALSTLMPYKGGRGPVLLAARTLGPVATGLPSAPAALRRALAGRTWTLALYYCRPWGKWTRFGTLSLDLDPVRADTGIRFDPVLHPLPGAGIYGWIRQLREPSYAAARAPEPPQQA
jgi:hypothetical protein